MTQEQIQANIREVVGFLNAAQELLVGGMQSGAVKTDLETRGGEDMTYTTRDRSLKLTVKLERNEPKSET